MNWENFLGIEKKTIKNGGKYNVYIVKTEVEVKAKNVESAKKQAVKGKLANVVSIKKSKYL